MLALTARLKLIGLRRKEVGVSASVLYMSMSLDGYIAGPNDEGVALLHDLMPGLLKPCCDAFHGDTSVKEM